MNLCLREVRRVTTRTTGRFIARSLRLSSPLSWHESAERLHQPGVLFAPLGGDANMAVIHTHFIGTVPHVHLVIGEQARLQLASRHSALDLEQDEIRACGID